MSILALTSDTLVTAASGQIEYNGQFFGTDSNASRAQLQRIVLSTDVASTSGTAIDFTSIPSWVKQITLMGSSVSLNNTASLLVQLGDSGGIESTGYLSTAVEFGNSPINNTTGFGQGATQGAASATQFTISMTLVVASSNTWAATGMFARSDAANIHITAGSKSLSAALDRVRLTTVAGTAVFDAGSVNILYEG